MPKKPTSKELESARAALSDFLQGKHGTHHHCTGWKQNFATAEERDPDCAVCQAIATVKRAGDRAPWRDTSEQALRALPEFLEGQIACQGGHKKLTECPYAKLAVDRQLCELLQEGVTISGLVWEAVFGQKFAAWCAGFNSAPPSHLTLVK